MNKAADYLMKKAILGTMLNPIGAMATDLMSDEGNPDRMATADKGGIRTLLRSILESAGGGAVGGLAGHAIGGPIGSAIGGSLGMLGGSLHGTYAAARNNAYKKPESEVKAQ